MVNEDISQIRRQKWLQHCEKYGSNDLETSSSFSSSTTSLSLPLLSNEDRSQHGIESQSNLNRTNDGDNSGGSFGKEDCDGEEIIDITSSPDILHSVGLVKGELSNSTENYKNAKSCFDLTISSADESDNDSCKGKDNDYYNVKKGSKSDSYKSKHTNFEKGNSSPGFGCESLGESDTIPEFSICTYNIWFKETHQPERMMQISSLLSDMKQQKPLFIGLQEVTMSLMQELFPLLESMGYTMICQPDITYSYGVAIAVFTQPQQDHPPSLPYVRVVKSGFQPFTETIMGRGLLWVHADIIPWRNNCNSSSSSSKSSVLFTTTHLESFVPKHQYSLPDKINHNGVKARKSQIQESVTFCQKYRKSSSFSSSSPIQAMFITGDLNWDDERKQAADESLLSIINDNNDSNADGWIDAWKSLYPTQRGGYTYDSKLNPMLKGNLRRRFDRCLYYIENNTGAKGGSDKCSKLGVCGAKLIGMEAIEGIQWQKEVSEWKYGKPTGAVTHQVRPVSPSDHFGVYVQFGNSSETMSCEPTKKRKLNDCVKS